MAISWWCGLNEHLSSPHASMQKRTDLMSTNVTDLDQNVAAPAYDVSDNALLAASEFKWTQANGVAITLGEMSLEHLLNLRTYLHKRQIRAMQAHELRLIFASHTEANERLSSPEVTIDNISQSALMVALELRRRIRASVRDGQRGAIPNDGPNASYGSKSDDLHDAICVDEDIPFQMDNAARQ
jgi:hypothetical protein